MDSDERCQVTFTGTVSIALINPGWWLEIAGPHQRCVVPRSVLTEPHAVAPSSLASTRSRGGGTALHHYGGLARVVCAEGESDSRTVVRYIEGCAVSVQPSRSPCVIRDVTEQIACSTGRRHA